MADNTRAAALPRAAGPGIAPSKRRDMCSGVLEQDHLKSLCKEADSQLFCRHPFLKGKFLLAQEISKEHS